MTVLKKDEPVSFGAGLVLTLMGGIYLAFTLAFFGPSVWTQLTYRPTEASVGDRRWGEEHSGKGRRYYRLEALLTYRIAGQDYQAWVAWPQTTRQQTGPVVVRYAHADKRPLSTIRLAAPCRSDRGTARGDGRRQARVPAQPGGAVRLRVNGRAAALLGPLRLASRTWKRDGNSATCAAWDA